MDGSLEHNQPVGIGNPRLGIGHPRCVSVQKRGDEIWMIFAALGANWDYQKSNAEFSAAIRQPCLIPDSKIKCFGTPLTQRYDPTVVKIPKLKATC